MGTKANPGRFDCYRAAEPNEPMMILLARDSQAALLTRRWAWGRQDLINRSLKPETDRPMVVEALECADKMDAWRAEYRPSAIPVEACSDGTDARIADLLEANNRLMERNREIEAQLAAANQINLMQNQAWLATDKALRETQPALDLVNMLTLCGEPEVEVARARGADLPGQLRALIDGLIRQRSEADRLAELINTPEFVDFVEAVKREAAHQRERWGEAHDRSKSAENWYWLVGFLAGKALRAHIDGDLDKARHHTISSAAALSQWHAWIGRDPTGNGVGQDGDLKPNEIAA